MPKSESSSTPKVRQERWARGPVAVSKKKANGKGKGKASRPVVSVTYEDGSGPSNGSGPNGKGKSKAHDADGDFEIEDGQDEDQEEEDIKPDIVDTQVPAPPSIVNENKSSSSSSFIIVAGSYEKNLYGLQASFKKDSLVPTLEPIFIFPAHISCIKAAAAAPLGARWLATGSDDEIVKIWDLRRRKEVGGLSQHVGKCSAASCQGRRSPLYEYSAEHLELIAFTQFHIYLLHRIYHRSHIPDPFTSPLCVRRLHDLPVPYKRLGSSSYAQRPLWPSQLCRCPPEW